MEFSPSENATIPNDLLAIEGALREEGFLTIAGVDEAGRGPLAGPVYAAACIIPQGVVFEGINDSKQLTAAQREELFHQITNHPGILFGIASSDHKIIDRINILQATFHAMREAVAKLTVTPDLVIIDGSMIPKKFPWRAKPIVKGDGKCQSIAAASILAKVSRDRHMKGMAALYPGYGFDHHFGYGTREHQDAIASLGICPIHRKTYILEDACSQLTLFPRS